MINLVMILIYNYGIYFLLLYSSLSVGTSTYQNNIVPFVKGVIAHYNQ